MHGKLLKRQIDQKKFLAAYAQCGIIGKACDFAHTTRGSHLRWLREDPEYAQRFAEAHEDAMDRLEAEANRRGMEGWEEPVVYQGQLCYPVVDGKPTKKPLMIRKYSDPLLMFVLRGGRPEKYRETFKGDIRHSGAVALPTLDVTSFSDEQLTHISAILQIAGVNDTGAPRALANGNQNGAGAESEESDS